jgi:hypothetical protein
MGRIKQLTLQANREATRGLRHPGGKRRPDGYRGPAAAELAQLVAQRDGAGGGGITRSGPDTEKAGGDPEQRQVMRARSREKVSGLPGFDLAAYAVANGQAPVEGQAAFGEGATKVQQLGRGLGRGGDLFKGGTSAQNRKIRDAMRVFKFLSAARAGKS